MDNPQKKRKVVQTLYKIDEEVDHLKKQDRKFRKGHGSNQIIDRIDMLANSLRNMILGECEFAKKGVCTLPDINDECNVIVEECYHRKKKLEEIEIKKQKKKKRFERIEGYKIQEAKDEI